MPSFQVYLLSTAGFYIIYRAVFFYIFPIPASAGLSAILIGFSSTLTRFIGITITIYIMTKEDISQIIPLAFTYPVFVAIIALPLLREILYYLQWMAIIVVVSGAIMVSVKKDFIGATTILGKNFLILFGVSLLFAFTDIGNKYVLTYLSPMNMLAFVTLSMCSIFLIVSLRPHVIQELAGIKLERSTTALIFLNEILTPVAMVLFFSAMQNGPVSLVATIHGTRPIFIGLYSLILSRLAPKFLIHTPSKGLLLLRLVVTAIIVTGIAIIYLA